MMRLRKTVWLWLRMVFICSVIIGAAVPATPVEAGVASVPLLCFERECYFIGDTNDSMEDAIAEAEQRKNSFEQEHDVVCNEQRRILRDDGHEYGLTDKYTAFLYYLCPREDEPGDKDDEEDCKRFTSTARGGLITIQDLIDSGVPVPPGARELAHLPPIIGGVLADGVVAYVQLKGEWCYKDGRVTSYRTFEVIGTPTGIGDLAYDTENTFAGQVDILRDRETGQVGYTINGTRTDVILVIPVGVTVKVPGTEIGFEMSQDARIKVHTINMTTLLSGHGDSSCTQNGNNTCTVEEW